MATKGTVKNEMSTKNAKKYDKVTQNTLVKIIKFYKLCKQIKTLTNTKNTLEKELIEELLKDKKNVHKNQYLDIGKFFIGVAQANAPKATVKAELEKKLIELGIDIEPMRKEGTTPKAVLKVETTGRK